MSDSVLITILSPLLVALVTAVGALWRRSVSQRDKFIEGKAENAGMKADLRAAHQDIGELREKLQERIFSEEYLLSYIEALEALCRKHGVELPERPRLRRLVQRSTKTQEAVNE